MKFLKKAVSALLASIMCIPAGILNFAEAEEENTVTTVTLADTENGFMQFSEDSMESSTASQDGYHMVQVNEAGELEQVENDGSMWAYNPGDFVEVELFPDDGYNVKSFAIKDSATGDVMAKKETMDNIFSFTMPNKSLTVEAVFSSSSTVEVVPDKEAGGNEGDERDDGGLDVQSKYHDITESTEITESEVEEVIFDLTTESYIKANVNPEYMELDGTNEPVDALHIKQTLFDGRYIKEDDTIDSVMETIEEGNDAQSEDGFMKFLGQTEADVFVYEFSKSSDYYVAYANTMQKDETSHVQDWAFAYNNIRGMSIDGCIYDENTGILYIPKQAYADMNAKFAVNENDSVIGNFQIQFMQVLNNENSPRTADESVEVTSQVHTVGINEEEASVDVNTEDVDIFACETTTFVDAGMDAGSMEVCVNGIPVNKDNYEYDTDTGELTIGQSSASIISIEVSEKDESVKDKLLDIISDDADADAYDSMQTNIAPIIINNPNKMPKSTDSSLFQPFQVTGYIDSAKTHGAQYYYSNGGAGDAAAAAIAKYARGSSGSKNFTPAQVDATYPLNHRSVLNNAAYQSGMKNDTILKMLRKFGARYTPCSHIDRDGLVTPHSSNQAPGTKTFWVRVVKIKDPKEKTTENTEDGIKTTVTTWTGGYVIFAVASTQIYTQTSCFLFKVPFEGSKSKQEETNDPFYLALFKDAGQKTLATGEPLDNSKLSGAVFKCDFYANKRFDDPKLINEYRESGKKPTCSWTYTTSKSMTKGSKYYYDTLEQIPDEYESGEYDIAGIDFGPKKYQTKSGNKIPRDEWVNKYIDSGDLKSWRANFGKKGTYHIYEVTPPRGFRIGKGYAFDINNKSNKSEDLTKSRGMAVYMDTDVEKGTPQIFMNGQKSNNLIIAENKKDPPPGAMLYVRNVNDTTKTKSNASVADTAVQTQEAQADSGPLRVMDTVLVYPFVTKTDVIYQVTTTLYDKKAEKYVNVQWDTSSGGVVQEEVPLTDTTFYVPSSITHTIRESDIERKCDPLSPSDKDVVELKVYGTIETDGLENHTLVFINTLNAYEESEVDIDDDIDGDDDGTIIKEKGFVYQQSSMNAETEYIKFKKSSPGLDTILSSNETERKSAAGTALACMDQSQSFKDIIHYKGLTSGKKYTVKAWLVDAASEEKVKSGSNYIEVSEEKTASGESGDWDVKFTFDTTGMEGKKLVSYVEVYDGTTLVFEHKEIGDTNEMLMIPKVSTELIDKDTLDHMSSEGNIMLLDTISYTNLIEGATYKVKSSLMDAETGEVATDKNGTKMEKETEVNADSENGSFDIDLEFDIAVEDAKSYVAFEELYIEKGSPGSGEWVLVASHKDLDDEMQKTVVPKIKTFAIDQKTDNHISFAEKNVVIYETLHYEDFQPDTEYKVVSKLVDKATNEVVVDDDGNEQVIELTFNTKEDHDIGHYIRESKKSGNKDKEEEKDSGDSKTDDKTSSGTTSGRTGSGGSDSTGSDDSDSTSSGGDAAGGDTAAEGDTGTDSDDKKEGEKKSSGLAYGDIRPNNHVDGGIVFKLNAESFAGRTLVVYEEVYKEGENGMRLIASEMDPENEEQTIHFPKVWTNAVDSKTQSSIALSGDGTTIIKDTISYENVIPGLTYEIRGRVVDRRKTMESGAEVVAVGSDGNPAKNSVRFTPDEPDGTEELTFDIDTSKYTDDMKIYKGAVFVVYEELYAIQRYDGDDAESIVASHTDIDDTNQTIYIPYITTTLLDAKTGLHIMYAEKDASLVDTVSYYSCKPGQVFYVSGRLVDMKTNKTLVDSAGNEAKIEYQQFRASGTGDGTVELTYNIDASALAGTTVVAYAQVYVQGGSGEGGYTPVAIHDEFFDKDERVYIPYIDTTLLDQKTDSHYAVAEKDVVLYDTVHYTDVMPGDYEYKFETELRDQATGQIVKDDSGKDLSLTTSFIAHFDMRDDQFATYGDVIPQNYEGSGITFEIDGEYFADRTLVCYERLYIKGVDGGWHIVADHQDLMDSEQTVHFGKGWTEAADAITKTQTGKISKNATIVDTFYYNNLKPGYTYELHGKVVEKKSTIATGTDVVVAENVVTGLTPETSSGAWHNSFTFDATKYNSEEYYGTTLVVYEELYQVKRYDGSDDRMLIAFEKDVNSSAQTVWFPHIETELTVSANGTHVLSTGENCQVVDDISYHNMQPGTDYVLSGRLVDMETGQTLTDSKGQRMEKTINVMSSDNGDGTWEITYTLDTSKLGGKMIVAYADVYIRNGDDKTILSSVAEHSEFWDGKERVYVPVVSTVATDQKTNGHISYAEENMWVTDRVYYSYLQPDTNYRLVSTLVDKETQEVVVDDKGIVQRIETDFNTKANTSQEKYVQMISNPLTDSSDTGIGYAYGYVVPGDGTVLPDGEKPDGIVFSFDGHTFEGRTLVIYEELQMYTAKGEWETVTTHMDINDENQTVHVPKIRTNAMDSETMTYVSKKDGSVTIIDTVTYENLLPGMTYTIEGRLMDKLRDDEKGSLPIKDTDGNWVTATTTFTPKNPNGTEKLSFKCNVDSLHTDEGEFSSDTLVVFEELYLVNSKDASSDKLKVAEHCDIDDENQTIFFPRVKTKVMTYDLAGNPKEGDANHVNGYAVYDCTYCKRSFLTETEAQNHINSTVLCKNKGASVKAVTEYAVYDTLYYENLIPGRTYQVVGTLIDTATGEAVLKGHTVVQSDTKYFTPGAKNGEVDVVFHVDGLDLAGGRYVVYEEVFLNGSSVASHMDIKDKDQMFNIIDMRTSAKDSDTGTNISAGNTISTIIDTVEMGPLVENEKYYLTGTLMDVTKEASGAKSENYGSYYKDATGAMVQGKQWRVKGTSVWHDMSEPVTGPEYSRTGGMLSVEVKFTVDTITEHGKKNFQGETYVLPKELRKCGSSTV